MRSPHPFLRRLLLVLVFCSLIPFCLSAQLNNVQPRITAAVDESKLAVLRGNTHPLARAEFDRGPAPASLQMEGMLLVLKRSPEQEAALETLLAEQQDQSSLNYHKWLTPAEFGSEFGPADQDIQTITSWLGSHGFQVGNVSNGRTVIEFSGVAGQVQEAFHTTIHQYVVNGEEHWANSTDPSIPAAVMPVVAGVRSLHNFHPRAMHRVSGIRTSSNAAAEAEAVKPQFTFPSGCTSTTCFFGLGPVDFATIYNVLPLWNAGIDGTGETIAVVSDSNINLQDVTDFRSMFGLPAKPPTVIVPSTIPGCTDPGLQPAGDEIEAILDVEWSGAVARNANIDLVTCKSTTTFGGDLAAEYIIDYPNIIHSNTSTGLAPILSESFGDCELELGSSANAMYNNLWSQAAAEGITVIVSTGDNGSAGCDVSEVSGSPTQPAKLGLQVNGLASTPFNVAVGGTEFSDLTDPFIYWNQASGNAASTGASAFSYIPETAWNDTCTNPVVYGTFFTFSSAAAACNNGTVGNDGYVVPVGGSGGASSCTTYNGANPSSCTGGYSKPSWQSGGVTPNDGKRDIPDISLFAGDGTISGSFYIVCERDYPGGTPNAACSLSLSKPNFLEVGGTSVSTQAFAGIMALVDQKNESAEGLINPKLYSLAGTAGSTCTSTGSPLPPSTCVFYDVADGSTNAMPCQAQATNSQPVVSPDCPVTASGPIGVLTNPITSQFAYSAGAGYDLATGLGSVNAASFVNAPTVWNTAASTNGADFTLSFTNSSILTIPKGSSGMIGVTVTPENGFTGNVAISCPSAASLPSGVTCSVGASVNGSTNIDFMTTAATTWTPINPANHIGLPRIAAMLALALALCMFLMLLARSDHRRRLTRAMVVVAFALAVASAGCGSGSSSSGGGNGGNPGTPTGTSFVVITATSGSIQRSLALTLIVD